MLCGPGAHPGTTWAYHCLPPLPKWHQAHISFLSLDIRSESIMTNLIWVPSNHLPHEAEAGIPVRMHYWSPQSNAHQNWIHMETLILFTHNEWDFAILKEHFEHHLKKESCKGSDIFPCCQLCVNVHLIILFYDLFLVTVESYSCPADTPLPWILLPSWAICQE